MHNGGATKNLPHRKGTEVAGNHPMVELNGRIAAATLTNRKISALMPAASAQAGQQVLPVGSSAVLDRRPHLHPVGG